VYIKQLANILYRSKLAYRGGKYQITQFNQLRFFWLCQRWR